jgi:2-iminobutanoate/2-iminopropanoate deaminase
LRAFASLALAIGLIILSGQPCYAQEHHAINLSNARGLPFSDGIVAGSTLYIAGQEGTDDSGKLITGGIAAETKAALENVQKVTKAAGFDIEDIVSVTVYLADIHEFGDMNQVYKSFLPDPKPARATIQAAALVNNARIEISAIAVSRREQWGSQDQSVFTLLGPPLSGIRHCPLVKRFNSCKKLLTSHHN